MYLATIYIQVAQIWKNLHKYGCLATDPRNKICDRLWENGAFGAENKNVVVNLF